MDTRSIIEMAGGASAIAAASANTKHHVGVNTVHKWRENGIPDWHWPLIIRLTNKMVDPVDLHEANESARARKF